MVRDLQKSLSKQQGKHKHLVKGNHGEYNITESKITEINQVWGRTSIQHQKARMKTDLQKCSYNQVVDWAAQRNCSCQGARASFVRLWMDKTGNILGSQVFSSLKLWSFVDQDISRWLLAPSDRTSVNHDSRSIGLSVTRLCHRLNFNPQNCVVVTLSVHWRQTHHNALLFLSHSLYSLRSQISWQHPVVAAPNSPSFPFPSGFSSSSGNQCSHFVLLHTYGFAFS